MSTPNGRSGPPVAAPYLGFAAFGLFWGVWAGALAPLRDRAGLDDAQLGGVLAGLGVGALLATAGAGWLIDRVGARVSGVFLALFALAAFGTAALGSAPALFVVGVLLIGITSGAADVSVNALAGIVEARTGARIIARSHAVFSGGVVVGSLGCAAGLQAGLPLELIFGVLSAVLLVAGAVLLLVAGAAHPEPQAAARTVELRAGVSAAVPFVLVGLVGALALAVESGHESWSSVFLADELGASGGLPPLAPAVFALALALGRVVYSVLPGLGALAVLLGGALVAAAGTVVLATAQSVAVALVGVAVAALGLAAVFPALLAEAVRDVPLNRRGRATSVVATTSYLGFLVAPALIGGVSGAADLRVAMIVVAALALAAGPLGAAVVVGRRRRAVLVPMP